jgi:hypothetical protein
MGRQMRMGQVRITVSTWLRPLWQPIEQELLRSRLNDAHSLYASNGRGIRSNQRNRVSHPAAAPRVRRTVFNPPLPQRLSRAWPSVEVVGVVGLGPFTSSQPCHSGSHPTLSRPPAYYCDPRLRLALSHFGAGRLLDRGGSPPDPAVFKSGLRLADDYQSEVILR